MDSRYMNIHRHKSALIGCSTLLLGTLLSGQALAYPDAKITNNTPYRISGKIEYLSFLCKDRNYSVAPGKTHVDRKGRSGAKTGCLISGITARTSGKSKHGENTSVVTYKSTGTSYGSFRIDPYGDRYRVFSDAEFKKVTADKTKSPGFRFVNKTQWPIVYSLEQVGCLYHDVLPARWNGKDGTRSFNTGAVWFTLRMHIQPDGENPQSDWDCVKPVAEVVGDVLLTTASAAATVATGGAAAPATGAALAKLVAKQAIKTAVKVSVKTISKKMVKNIGKYLTEAGTVTMAGQYAGYEWPVRCDKMPEYHVTGGPGYVRDEEGNFYLTPGPKFTVTKVNTCGDNMMLASPRSASAKTSLPFPKLDGSSTAKPSSGTTSSAKATVYQHCSFGGYSAELAPGRYNLQQLKAKGIKNDDLSSIKVPKGMTVKAYKHDNFKGQSWTFTANDSCFVNRKLNDVASSIEVIDLAQSCFSDVQGKVAWNKAGNKKWMPGNIKNLCAGTSNPQKTINCFKSQISSHGSWQKATASCKGKF
ncbi:MAG: hypothetical protein ACPG47_06460 [Leucothrix sp.]